MRVSAVPTGALRCLYNSLKEQYVGSRPMTKPEEETMWSTWHELNTRGWKWNRITSKQVELRSTSTKNK